MRAASPAAAVLALLSLAAATDCAGDSCGADQEAAALLQHRAAAAHEKRVQANTTETTTLTCYPDQATATCGASGKCFLDTEGCSSSGGGQCCMAAGPNGPLQCRFCNCFGTDYCANFPSPTPAPPSGGKGRSPTPSPTPAPPSGGKGRSPTPSPTPAPPSGGKGRSPTPAPDCPQPGPLVYGNKCEFSDGPNGYFYGCCQSYLTCLYGTCQYPPPTPAPPTTNCPQPGPLDLGNKCEYGDGMNGYWYGCCQMSYECSAPTYGTCQYPVAVPYR